MRTYKSRIKIPMELENSSTGLIGEKIFELWFTLNFQGEKIFKQLADRDYQQIDFADEKGFTYQVKATKHRTYTFNCCLDDLRDHLNSDYYVFIQIKDNYAYIESIYLKTDILDKASVSFKSPSSCFIWANDLLQQKLEI
jgi:hypothetical protein